MTTEEKETLAEGLQPEALLNLLDMITASMTDGERVTLVSDYGNFKFRLDDLFTLWDDSVGQRLLRAMRQRFMPPFKWQNQYMNNPAPRQSASEGIALRRKADARAKMGRNFAGGVQT